MTAADQVTRVQRCAIMQRVLDVAQKSVLDSGGRLHSREVMGWSPGELIAHVQATESEIAITLGTLVAAGVCEYDSTGSEPTYVFTIESWTRGMMCLEALRQAL